MPKFEDAIPEAIRSDEIFRDITDTGALATAFHTKMNAAAPSLLDLVPEDMRESTALKEAGDVAGLAKQFLNMQSHLGNSLRIPSENAGEDDLKAFAQKVMEKVPSLMFKPDGANATELEQIYKSLGKPEAADKYKLKEGVEVNGDIFSKLAKVAYENNFSNSQLSAVIESIMGMETDMSTASAATRTEDFEGLQTAWGSALDSKIAGVVKLAEATKAPASLIEALKVKAVNKETYEWLDSMVTSLTGGEGINFNDAGTGGGDAAMTPPEAKAQISEIMSNAKHPYRDVSHPQHADWIKPGGEMTKIMKMANPAG